MKVNMVYSTKGGGQLNIRIMGLTLIPDAVDRIVLIYLMSLYYDYCCASYINQVMTLILQTLVGRRRKCSLIPVIPDDFTYGQTTVSSLPMSEGKASLLVL